MSTSSTRTTTIVNTGDVAGTQTISAATNAAAPGQIEVKTLSSGANTITVPTGGTTPTAVTIVPPSGNTQTIVIKGITGDTGVGMHLTDPFTLSLAAATATFVITAGGTITGMKFYWS